MFRQHAVNLLIFLQAMNLLTLSAYSSDSVSLANKEFESIWKIISPSFSLQSDRFLPSCYYGFKCYKQRRRDSIAGRQQEIIKAMNANIYHRKIIFAYRITFFLSFSPPFYRNWLLIKAFIEEIYNHFIVYLFLLI